MGASADKKSPLPKQSVMLSHAITPVLKAGSFLNTTPTQHPHGSLSVSSQTIKKDKPEFPVQPFLWDRRMWHWTWCLLYYLQSSYLHRAPSNAKPRRGLCLYTCPCLAPTQKALQDPPPHYSPRFAAPMTLLGIFKRAFLTLRHCRFFFSSCKTVQYLQNQSIQQCKGDWTNVTPQMHQSAPDLHPALSLQKLSREGKGTEI